jgi:hypothetical protein
MHFFFVYDEYTDDMHKGEAQQIADLVIDAINTKDVPRPHGEHFLPEMARQ